MEIFTHRGISFGETNFGPEQTMPALLKAEEHGIRREVDVREVLRRKGGTALPLYHDDDLERTTGRKGPFPSVDKFLDHIRNATKLDPKFYEYLLAYSAASPFGPQYRGRKMPPTILDQIKGATELSPWFFEDLLELDAGSWYGPEYEGTKVPTLEDLLDSWKPTPGAKPHIEFDLDLKDDIGPKVVAAVKKRGLLPYVLFTSFAEGIILKVKRSEPDAKIGLIMQDDIVTSNNIVSLAGKGVEAIVPHKSTVKPETIERAHREGLIVIGWTDIEDGTDVGSAPGDPIDGMIVNDPVGLQRQLRGQRHTTPHTPFYNKRAA